MVHRVRIDKKDDYAVNVGKYDSVLYFFKGTFADGKILAFYSHSPWGRVHDQIRGWVLIDPKKKEVIDECETFNWISMNCGWKDWMRRLKQEHGKLTKIKNTWGEHDKWRMDEG
jgi:hypothetical protein